MFFFFLLSISHSIFFGWTKQFVYNFLYIYIYDIEFREHQIKSDQNVIFRRRFLLQISNDLFRCYMMWVIFARVHGRMLFAFRSCRLEILRRNAGRTHTDKFKERKRESVCEWVRKERERKKSKKKEYDRDRIVIAITLAQSDHLTICDPRPVFERRVIRTKNRY